MAMDEGVMMIEWTLNFMRGLVLSGSFNHSSQPPGAPQIVTHGLLQRNLGLRMYTSESNICSKCLLI